MLQDCKTADLITYDTHVQGESFSFTLANAYTIELHYYHGCTESSSYPVILKNISLRNYMT